MASSTTNLDTISANQASKEVTCNALLDASSPAMVFGRRASTCVALTWGYYGGRFRSVDKSLVTIANGTIALTGSTTNYVEADNAGVVSKNTTGFTLGRLPLYIIVCGESSVTSYTDERSLDFSMLGSRPSNSVITIPDGTSISINCNTTDIATHINTQAAGTLTINAPTGSPLDTQKIILRIKSTNAQTLSFNAAFTASIDLPFPTNTSGSNKWDYLGFLWNADTSKWQFISRAFGF